MILEPDATPIIETSLSAYFRTRLTRSAQRLNPPPHEETCWYIGAMLERFGRSSELFCYDEGRFDLRPLALLYADAREAPSERERCLLLQQLGDMALFLGALFPERFTRRGIHQDYVAGMGGSAYDYLAGNARKNRHIFSELASTFHHMLALVAEACSRTAFSSGDVLVLYRRWQETGDPAARNQLQALGVLVDGSAGTH